MTPPRPPDSQSDDERLQAAAKALVEDFVKRFELPATETDIAQQATKLVKISRDGVDLISAEWAFEARYGHLELKNDVRLKASGARPWVALAALAIIAAAIVAVTWVAVHGRLVQG